MATLGGRVVSVVSASGQTSISVSSVSGIPNQPHRMGFQSGQGPCKRKFMFNIMVGNRNSVGRGLCEVMVRL